MIDFVQFVLLICFTILLTRTNQVMFKNISSIASKIFELEVTIKYLNEVLNEGKMGNESDGTITRKERNDE